MKKIVQPKSWENKEKKNKMQKNKTSKKGRSDYKIEQKVNLEIVPITNAQFPISNFQLKRDNIITSSFSN